MSMQLQTKVKTEVTSAPVLSGILQRKCDDCRKKRLAMQPSAANNSESLTVPSVVHEVLNSLGHPLDTGTRDFMESRFGHDFSHVRIHGQASLPTEGEKRPRVLMENHVFPAMLHKEIIPPVYNKVEWLETGHTDCDWNRNVPEDEVYKPNSGNPVSKVTAEDDCTKPCTNEHEKTHRTQLAPVCKNYFECYTGAAKKGEASPDCKGGKPDDRNKCIALMTTILRYKCFDSLAEKWDADNWECQGYKNSLSCAQDLQKKSNNSCSGKIGAYIYSTEKSIEKYCKTGKKEPQKKGESKEPEKPPAKKQD